MGLTAHPSETPKDPKDPSIVCPRCGLRSFNAKDIEERYCGRCKDWHEHMPEGKWPNFCFDCGVYLMGGATVHHEECSIKRIIDETFHK